MRMPTTTMTGFNLSILATLLYATFNIYFKAVAGEDIHLFLFMSTAMLFGGAFMMILGGRTPLALPAMKCIYTWIYGVTFILECAFYLYMLEYITATDGVLLAHASIIVTLVLAYIFLGRNTLGKGIAGVPLIITGLAIVISGIEENLIQVLFLAACLSITKSIYYFSIELNKVAYEAKTYLHDFSVIGYILAATAFIFFMLFVIGAAIGNIVGYQPAFIPTVEDFYNWKLFVAAAFYGCFGVTALRYLEFKSIQKVKSEIFMCIISLTPFVTMLFEIMAAPLGLSQYNVTLDLPLLLANVLVISGSIVIVIRRYTHEELHEKSEVEEIRNIVLNTTVFYHDDYARSAKALGISLKVLNDIVNDMRHKMHIKHATADLIKENYFNKVVSCDALTGLTNRVHFLTDLKNIRKKETASLLFIDLNKFKPINDTYGHDAGDLVLIEVGERLMDFAGRKGIVTRMGGDEFCILLKDTPKNIALGMLESLQEVVAEPITYKGEALQVTASIGLANYPEDTSDPGELVSIADKAMYREKDSER